jgi:serine-type D-Ala-D-Ala carboxypeptidase/endopeptidase (penicillin-binding protein 4)
MIPNRITRVVATLTVVVVPLLAGTVGLDRVPAFGSVAAASELQQSKTKTKTKKAQPKTRTKAKGKAAPKGRRAVPALPPLNRTEPRSAEQLRADLADMLTRRVRSGEWGVMVTSLSRGDTLFAANVGVPLLPASTMKLVTAALALDRLGPDHRLSTDVLHDGRIDSDGTLRGNLYLRGDGDPTLSRRYHGGDYSSPMAKLVDIVQRAGVSRIDGSVIGDASAFDEEAYPAGWLDRYRGAGYAARVSPLSLNDNIVWVTVAPASRSGQPARVWLEPATTTIRLQGSVNTVAGRGTAVRANNSLDGYSINVRGSIGANSAVRRFGLVVEHPSMFTTGAFHAALLARGITISGEIGLGTTPRNATQIGSLSSPPVEQIIAPMNRESINLFAELLFKNAARGPQRERQGTARAAEEVLRDFFARRVGSEVDGLVAADGSGLSTLDRLTSRQMIQLLHYAHHASWGPTFHASLPVAGLSELMRLRMRQSPAEGNLHAKTGTTDTVIGLAGYVTAENGEVLAFSFIYNGTDRWNARSTIDVMGETLAGFARP